MLMSEQVLHCHIAYDGRDRQLLHLEATTRCNAASTAYEVLYYAYY
jgi:hypothetical protein